MLDHETLMRSIRVSADTYPDKESFIQCLEQTKRITTDYSLIVCIERTMEFLD